jgi:hypothetical protein
MPDTTTFNFMLEAKYGSALVSGGTTTGMYKRIIINYGTFVEVMTGAGIGKMQNLQGNTSFTIPNKSGVPLTVVALMSDKTLNGKPVGFFQPLLIAGEVYQATQKSNRIYLINCFHPVSKLKLCSLSLWLENWQELK